LNTQDLALAKFEQQKSVLDGYHATGPSRRREALFFEAAHLLHTSSKCMREAFYYECPDYTKQKEMPRRCKGPGI